MISMKPADESSDCLCYSCCGSESESPVLRAGVYLKKVGGGVAGSVVDRDGY